MLLLRVTFALVVLTSVAALPLSEFFPYGPSSGDSTFPPNDDASAGPFTLPYLFPYFDNNHRQIWLANNGLFSFLSAISQYTPDPFPLANDQRLVTGFWADIDTSGFVSGVGNKVYYQIHSDTLPNNVTNVVLTKASDYVRRFFSLSRPFQPKMVITGTWYRVGAFSSQTDRLNTFQIVLATDGDRSFTFLLYHDLQWAGPRYTTEPYAQAGFNAGDGIAFQMLPYSRTANIVRLVNESNVNVPGLFVFRVDTDDIDGGGCTANFSSAVFRPRTSSQLGSTALTIQGPCFTNETILKCRFDSTPQVLDGIIIDSFRAICLTPLAPTHGPTAFRISLDGGNTYIPAGTFTYAPVRFGSDEVRITGKDGTSLLHPDDSITLHWGFSDSIQSVFPNDTYLDIELWPVSLNGRSELQQGSNRILLAQDIPLTDTSHQVQLPSSIASIQTCFIRVVARTQSKVYAGLNTGLLIVHSTSSLAIEKCSDWSRQQPEPSTWNGGNLLPCPMTRTQAVAAGRCCYEADPECYANSPNPNNCWLHQGRADRQEQSAVECYRSKNYNNFNASAECCYDAEGQLITRGTGSGTDDRYHPVAYAVQHFFDDTLPYLHCCMMTSNIESCDTYMRYRPPRRGSNTMGENGGTWGDPHLTTLDGTSYTFNGYGEYVYLAISESSSPPATFDPNSQTFTFMSQIRTIPLVSNDATVTKGFAARSSDSESQPISVTISRRENLVLYRGNTSIEFDDNIDTLVFPEMTIERNGTDMNTLILSWNIGVTVQISLVNITVPSRSVAMNVGVSVAGLYRGRTYGLLGTYDGQSTNDLRRPDGRIVSANASLENIHREFGSAWTINPRASLFHYESGQSASFFVEQSQSFVPLFNEPQNTPAQETLVRAACQIDADSSPSSWNVAQRTCYYDVSVTKDENFGQTSLNAGKEMLTIKANQRNPPLFDASLPISIAVKKNEKVELKINATTEYVSNTIEVSAVHLPSGANFDPATRMFRWTAGEKDDYLRIRATDVTYNLTATHEITFQVEGEQQPGASARIDLSLSLLLIATLLSAFLCMN